MRTLDITSTLPVLFPTNDSKNPFVIEVEHKGAKEYWVVRKDGTLSGDGFSSKEKTLKYFPNTSFLIFFTRV